jgi:hypothetical protein
MRARITSAALGAAAMGCGAGFDGLCDASGSWAMAAPVNAVVTRKIEVLNLPTFNGIFSPPLKATLVSVKVKRTTEGSLIYDPDTLCEIKTKKSIERALYRSSVT